MKPAKFLPALLLAALAGGAALVPWGPLDEVYALMVEEGPVVPGRGQGDGRLASVLRLIVEETDGGISRGSGAWTNRGVYTAWHVVEKAEAVTVYDINGKGHRAWGWWRLGGQDAALVRLEEPLTVPMLRVALGPITGDGQAEVLAFWGQGAEAGLAGCAVGQVMLNVTAIPSAIRDLGPDFYGTTIPIVPGMSGGPLVVGDVVFGVVSHIVPNRASYMARCDTASAPPVEPRKAGEAPKPKVVPRPAPAPAACPGGT